MNQCLKSEGLKSPYFLFVLFLCLVLEVCQMKLLVIQIIKYVFFLSLRQSFIFTSETFGGEYNVALF